MPQTKEKKIAKKTLRKPNWFPMTAELEEVFKEVITKSRAGIEYSKFIPTLKRK